MATRTAYATTVKTAMEVNGAPLVTCDLRSDTVTKPCRAMKEAMMAAEVGDDVMGDDPTVLLLERRVAEMCGKEAGLFVASGTMSNQLAVRACVGALDGVICDMRCHVHNAECGGVAYHSQAMLVGVDPKPAQHLTVDTVAAAVMAPDLHHAVTKMILLENTLGGSVFPLAEMQRIKQFAESKGLLVHLDGARLWCASAATGVSLEDYSKCADSVSLCLSKTLGAPVGSVLVGTRSTIERARHFRKLFGGAWRQAGLLAAAGLYAIEHNFPLLKEVHQRTLYLAESLTRLGFVVNAEFGGAVDTNMVFADASALVSNTKVDWAAMAARLATEGILIPAPTAAQSSVNRLVLHHQVQQADLKRMLTLIEEMLTAPQR